ncbi:MAG: RNA polymerase sigma factor [Acidobacteriota bacterium]
MATAEPLHLLSAADLLVHCGSTDDPAAWNEFVNRFHRRILLYVLREVRTLGWMADEAEIVRDLAQEIYLRLLANDRRALREFRGNNEPAVLAYLICVVRSVVSDHMRRQTSQKRAVALVSLDHGCKEDQHEITLADILPASDQISPDRMLNERMAPQRLQELLMSVLTGSNAARDAVVFQLHVVNGLSAREIAELPAFQMTLSNVEAVIRRTRERLRSVLSSSDPSQLSV